MACGVIRGGWNMGFIVVHKGGMCEREYRHYLVMVGRRVSPRGVTFDHVPRTMENGRDGRWLYVSEDEADARDLAAELRSTTEDEGWEVRAVEGEPSQGPLTPLTVEVSRGNTGAGFGIGPVIKKALRRHHPGCARHKNVWLNTDFPRETLSADDLRELAFQLLPVLTGLSLPQLAMFEGIEVIDPAKDEVLVPFTPFPSSTDGESAVAPRHSDRVEVPDRCTPAIQG
jgi:hypothetical protein